MINKIIKKTGLTSKITRQKLDLFIRKYQSRKLTLDIGCSNSPYAKYFPNRVGLDIHTGQGVDIVADAHQLPFKDEKFDNVLCTEVLEHLHSPHLAISEMKRVLKLGGKLILSTRFIFPLHDVPNDYYRYTKYGLKYLFKDWQIIELKEEVNTLTTLAVLLQRIGYQCEILGFKPLKLLFFLKAKIVSWFSFIITKEYGDIRKEQLETNIMASGYYLVARKI